MTQMRLGACAGRRDDARRTERVPPAVGGEHGIDGAAVRRRVGEGRDLALELRRLPQVVAVEDGDERAVRGVEAGLARDLWAAPFGSNDESHLGVARGQRP